MTFLSSTIELDNISFLFYIGIDKNEKFITFKEEQKQLQQQQKEKEKEKRFICPSD